MMMLLLSGCSHLPPCCAPEQQLCQPEGLPGRGEVSHLSITTDPNYFTINVSPIFLFIFYCAVMLHSRNYIFCKVLQPKYVLTKQNQLYNLTFQC